MSFFLPLALLRFRTFLPTELAVLFRNPCVLFLFLTLVLVILISFIVYQNITNKSTPVLKQKETYPQLFHIVFQQIAGIFYVSLSISASLDPCGIIANERKRKARFRFDEAPPLEASVDYNCE